MENSDELTVCLVNSINQTIHKLNENLPQNNTYELNLYLGTDSFSYDSDFCLTVGIQSGNSRYNRHHKEIITAVPKSVISRTTRKAYLDSTRELFNEFTNEAIWQAWH